MRLSDASFFVWFFKYTSTIIAQGPVRPKFYFARPGLVGSFFNVQTSVNCMWLVDLQSRDGRVTVPLPDPGTMFTGVVSDQLSSSV